MMLPDRFWAKVREDGGCWVWTGSRDRNGYGMSHSEGRMQLAHRLAYEGLVAPIPGGLTIDHLCKNRSCVNPWHMEPVPHRVNTLRGNSASALNARKTHCKRGHEFTPENTYTFDAGRRRCRECTLAAHRDLRATKARRSA